MTAGTSYTPPGYQPATGSTPGTAGLYERWALVLLAVWTAAPIVYLLLKASAHHESLSGGDSLFAADQLQYLAWIRSSGEHALAANGFALRKGGHVFFNPMFAVSGLLWRAGVNIALSYLLWAPVAVVALYVGFRAFIDRYLLTPPNRVTALVLALFFVTPAAPLAGWTVGSNGLGELSGQLSPTSSLYGYFPVVIALGLLALFMLGLDRIGDRTHQPPPGALVVAGTAVAGLLVSWLHPWQGATALVALGVLLALPRFRTAYRRLLAPAVATALPLGYYLSLSRFDAAWQTAQLQSPAGRPNVGLLALAVAPLLGFAVVAARRPAVGNSGNPILFAWPLAALIVYLVAPEYGPHALEGLSLPLAVLSVRGWQRLRGPRWLAALLIVVCTVPGLVYTVQLFHDATVSDTQALLLRQDEKRALAFLDRSPHPGGVLPSVRISAAVPGYTGRRTWIGHSLWTPDYSVRLREVDALFTGGLSGAAGRQFLRGVGARYLLADCEPRFHARWLGTLLVSARRFGCVSVYELSVPNRARPL